MARLAPGRHPARCHCGAVELELNLPTGLNNPQRCTCSICRRRGTVFATVTLDNLKVVKGADKLRLYQFNTMTAKHYFCSNCGIYTHHQRRSDPSAYAFNVACLDGIDPYALDNVTIFDGANHPSDRKADS